MAGRSNHVDGPGLPLACPPVFTPKRRLERHVPALNPAPGMKRRESAAFTAAIVACVLGWLGCVRFIPTCGFYYRPISYMPPSGVGFGERARLVSLKLSLFRVKKYRCNPALGPLSEGHPNATSKKSHIQATRATHLKATFPNVALM